MKITNVYISLCCLTHTQTSHKGRSPPPPPPSALWLAHSGCRASGKATVPALPALSCQSVRYQAVHDYVGLLFLFAWVAQPASLAHNETATRQQAPTIWVTNLEDSGAERGKASGCSCCRLSISFGLALTLAAIVIPLSERTRTNCSYLNIITTNSNQHFD